jgi:LysM repeat protein
MKRILIAAVLLSMVFPGFQSVFAQNDEPTIYVIKKGDTLWGLSDRFLKDPHYWPDLWAANPKQITNPHLIFPGQKLKVYPDRIEVAEAATGTPGKPQAETPKATEDKQEIAEEVAPEKSFSVNGGEGFLLEKGFNAAGIIIAAPDNRKLLGDDDIAYTDIGSNSGAKVGKYYSIFKNAGPVTHPVSSVVIGSKIVPLGTLKLEEMEEKTSRAVITDSFLEVGVGAYLMPYRDKRREVSLLAADRDLSGYVVDSLRGIITIGAGEIVYLDLGREQGLKTGNMLYVVRDVVPEQKFLDLTPLGKLPDEVLGVVVVVDTGKNTATALVVKSVNAIYRGDRVELKKSY